MIPVMSIPRRILKLLEANIAPSEIAAGVCMGMFLGFIPLYGPMTIVLVICFFLFKLNKLSVLLSLPVFKLLYILGFYKLADFLGGILLIDAGFLVGFWRWVTGLPIIAYLGIGNTLVTGGLVLSGILCAPVYFGLKRLTILMREKYAEKITNLAIVKWFKKLLPVQIIFSFLSKIRGKS